MLLECFENIGKIGAVKMLRSFLQSTWFLVLVVLLMVFSNLFALELPVYYLYLLLWLLIVLFDDDLKQAIPVIICCYMSVSRQNNPAVYPPQDIPGYAPSVFYHSSFVVQLCFIIAAAVILLLARLITVLLRGEKKKVPLLAVGFGALGLSYVLAGLFSHYYSLRTAFFGLTEIVALSGLYFLFYYGVGKERLKRGDLAVMLSVIGVGVLVEAIGLYFVSGQLKVLLEGGEVDRGFLVTGWGMYNNVGCVLAICAPAPLYLATQRKRGYLYALLGVLLMCGIVITQSRGSMLFGGIAFLLGIVLMIVCSKGKDRLFNSIAIGACAAAAVIVLIVLLCVPSFRDSVQGIFADIFRRGFDNNGRWEIYVNGIEQFKEAPFFGVGFYQCTAFQWGAGGLPSDFFLPPRYHDTYVQLLASGGVFALACYLLHRAETVFLFLRKPTAEKLFIAVSIAALLLTSITDCHLFNFGPGFFYGTMLAYAELSTENN